MILSRLPHRRLDAVPAPSRPRSSWASVSRPPWRRFVDLPGSCGASRTPPTTTVPVQAAGRRGASCSAGPPSRSPWVLLLTVALLVPGRQGRRPHLGGAHHRAGPRAGGGCSRPGSSVKPTAGPGSASAEVCSRSAGPLPAGLPPPPSTAFTRLGGIACALLISPSCCPSSSTPWAPW
ncbi:hypothetical protein QJS66_15845 [Kocuria rhizophila]|nr:hypothetical protein QJS66_15845 [Kocuria rhizophila]